MAEKNMPGQSSVTNKISKDYPINDGFTGEIITKTLQKGELLSRYGEDTGSYVSPKGTPFGERSLPASKINDTHSIFEVTKPIVVKSGKIAPYYGQAGLGTQHKLPSSVRTLLQDKSLRRI